MPKEVALAERVVKTYGRGGVDGDKAKIEPKSCLILKCAAK